MCRLPRVFPRFFQRCLQKKKNDSRMRVFCKGRAVKKNENFLLQHRKKSL
jgi:hypothetical protein